MVAATLNDKAAAEDISVLSQQGILTIAKDHVCPWVSKNPLKRVAFSVRIPENRKKG
jgi:hypothetical protein